MKADYWNFQLEEVTNSFLNEFDQLPQAQLNWKPNPGQWSIAQNIQHLIVVNTSYFPIFKSLHTHSYSVPWIGKFDFITKFIGKTVLAAVQPDRRKKMKTFTIWEPTTGDINDKIVDLFVKHQHELKEAIATSQDFIDNHVVIPSPANKMVAIR